MGGQADNQERRRFGWKLIEPPETFVDSVWEVIGTIVVVTGITAIELLRYALRHLISSHSLPPTLDVLLAVGDGTMLLIFGRGLVRALAAAVVDVDGLAQTVASSWILSRLRRALPAPPVPDKVPSVGVCPDEQMLSLHASLRTRAARPRSQSHLQAVQLPLEAKEERQSG
jgi:hypothetical protein